MSSGRSLWFWRARRFSCRVGRQGKDIEGMMWMLGRLLLRHEDQMGIDKTENNFVMFFKKDSALSLVPTFVKKAEHWHSLKEQKQAKMDELALPLRTFLFHSMLEALLLRLKETTQSQDQLGTAMTLQVFLPKEENQDLMIPFLKFDPETKALTPLSDRQAPRCDGDDQQDSGATETLPLPARRLEVPLDAEAAGSTPGPHRALPASDWQPDSGGHSALPPSPLDDPISCLATGGRLPAPGAHGPFSPGSRACEETPRVSPSVPCILRICNRSNHCYANSVMCALCWVEQLLSPAQVIWLPVMHALTQRMSLQAPVADLWDSLQWILMHAQWRFPHHQHDAAEYLCYCRRFLIPSPHARRVAISTLACLPMLIMHNARSVIAGMHGQSCSPRPWLRLHSPPQACSLSRVLCITGKIRPWMGSRLLRALL